MIRKIIKINEELCNGCTLCANACQEGAIAMIDGKAKLIRDDYCDGLGNCLPACPTGAITFEEREALSFDEEAVKRLQESKALQEKKELQERKEFLERKELEASKKQEENLQEEKTTQEHKLQSELMQWPVQIKLVPVNAPYFENANLLIAADCTAYAYANFHTEFMKKHVTIIGCPKLDSTDYSIKLTEILKNNNIKSVKVLRMEVPCCGGIEHAAVQALKNSEKMIPWQVITISCDGKILER